MGRPLGSKDKVQRKYKHSFARQYLEDHGVALFKGDERILEPIHEELYPIKLPNTRFYVGEVFAEEGETRKITSYEALKDLGFLIVSTNVNRKTRWLTGQKVMYELRRATETGEHINKIPKDHYIEYDPGGKVVRISGPRAGPLGYGPFIDIEKNVLGREGAGRKVHYKNLAANADRLINQQFNRWTGREEKPKPIYIPEAAFLITDANEIVCIPNTADMPSILIAGMKGSGKCIVQEEGSDFILDGMGRWVKIKDRPKTAIVLNKQLKLEKAKVNEYYKREVDTVLEIITAQGRKILLTPEHPLLTVLGWKQAQHLKPGDFIATPRRYDLGLKKRAQKHEVILLAYLIAAGTLDEEYIRFDHKYKDYEVRRDIEINLHRLDPKLKLKVRAKRRVIPEGKKDTLKEWLAHVGLLKVKHENKYIPNQIMELCDGQIRQFLSTFFSVSGFVGPHSATFITPNETVGRQIQHLLLRQGILSNIHNTRKIIRGKVIKRTNVIVASGDSLELFNQYFKPLTLYKARALENEVENLPRKNIGNHDLIPGDVWKLGKPKEWLPAFKALNYQLKKSQLKNMDFNVTRKSMEKIADATSNKVLNLFANSDVFWAKIRSIKVKKGKFTVWDVEIGHPDHNFVANDIIVHNSFALHSLVSRLFWKPEFDYKICILNDSSRETGTWCLPNSDPDQIHTLGKLNERPLPLPCVYLHPLVKEDYEKLFMGDVGFDVTIPFEEIVNRHKIYLNLKDSARYFTKIIDEMKDARTQDEAEQILDQMTMQHGVPPQTANKIIAEFETLFDTRMTDISTEGQLPWSTSKNTEKKYNPLTAAIHAGLLPVLETEFVSNEKKLLSIYFAYFAGDLFNRQKQDEDFLKEMSELLLVIDEAHNISAKGIKSGADMLLRRCVREGRPRRIGTMLATQKFNELPDVIKDNTTYLIVFKNPGEAAQIANQYNLGKHMVDRIKDLDKHQCMAYTTEHFVVYDTYGRRRKSKLNEVFVGKTLPPFSLHKRPKKQS